MKTISLVIVICLLMGCAHTQSTGPLWQPWTHSEKKEECMVKTAFWFILGTVALIYVIYRIDKHYKEKEEKNKIKRLSFKPR